MAEQLGAMFSTFVALPLRLRPLYPDHSYELLSPDPKTTRSIGPVSRDVIAIEARKLDLNIIILFLLMAKYREPQPILSPCSNFLGFNLTAHVVDAAQAL